MGFESLFLISLVITFGAIVFIIYHFKHNISILEKKCDTMFEIMNTLAQDVQKSKMIQPQQQFMGGLYNFQRNECDGSEDVEVTSIENEDENENENIFNRVVVSDDESENETDEENDTIKVINVGNDDDIDVEDLEDSPIEEINLDGDNEEDIEEEEDDDDIKEEKEEKEEEQDYKKMDISYLRTLVITRGLATDTKKMRKNELIKLLSQE